MLTECSRIMEGYIEFSWTQLGSFDTADDVIVIGAVIGEQCQQLKR